MVVCAGGSLAFTPSKASMEREGSFRYEEALCFLGVSPLFRFLLPPCFVFNSFPWDMQRQMEKWKKKRTYGHTHSRVTSFIHPSSHANMPLVLFCLVIRLQRFLSQLFLLFLSQNCKVSNCGDTPASCDLHQRQTCFDAPGTR